MDASGAFEGSDSDGEGAPRDLSDVHPSRKETIRYLYIASGSAIEAENHLLIAGDLDYITAEVRERFLGEIKTIQRMLAKLIDNLP